jgi:hypothetical protein
MCPTPHITTIRFDPSVPLDEVSQCDLLEADNLAADDSFSDVVESLAIRHHTRLCRLRSLNRTRSGCWTGSSSNDADADVHFRPHARTIVLDCWVPPHKICERYLLEAVHLIARHALSYPMELVAARDHSGLSWLGRLDTISWRGAARLRCCTADDADAHVHFSPHARAVVTNRGIPRDKLSKRDLLETDDLAARHALGYPVELSAVAHHIRLRGHWRRDTISCADRSSHRRLGASRR